MTSGPRARTAGAAALAGAVAFLPFLRGIAGGRSFYFRDLALYFFPLRRFVVEGLRAGEIRYWNPYVHEGVPLSLLPVSYPFDLLQALWPDEAGFSALLALHYPLAAIALFALARRLGLPSGAAVVGGLVYALGGFALSSLNLYVYVQAVAWSPLVILALIGAAEGDLRSVARAAAITAVALSTTGVEIVAQAVLVGLVLAATPRPRGLLRLGGALGLGAGLAAAPLWLTGQLVRTSERGAGFATDVVLAHSIHPLTFVQTLIAGLYGDPSRGADVFWGQNFFPRGFPYFLSLYLGATVAALAVTGAWGRGLGGRRLVALTLLAAVVGLGRFAGLQALVDALPPLHLIRFPSKAFFTVHLAMALLAARGAASLAGPDERRRSWISFSILAGGLGAGLLALSAVPPLWPRLHEWFLLRFFPPDAAGALRVRWTQAILEDAARGGLLALVAGLMGLAVLSRRITVGRGTAAVGVLAVADLLRAGAGLNPMVTTAFFRLSPEMTEQATSLRRAGRVFTCDVAQSPAYLSARAQRVDHEAWSFAILRESLTPDFNVAARAKSALSLDLTMLVPRGRVLEPDLASCRDPARLLPRLRRAGVAHLLSLDALEHPGLLLDAVRVPRDIAPLRIHVYRIDGAKPLLELAPPRGSASPAPPGRVNPLREGAGRLELSVESEGPGLLIVGEGFDAGWSARVNDHETDVARTDDDHLALDLPGGTSRVVLTYAPRGLRPALLVAAASLAAVWGLALARTRSAPPAPRE